MSNAATAAVSGRASTLPAPPSTSTPPSCFCATPTPWADRPSNGYWHCPILNQCFEMRTCARCRASQSVEVDLGPEGVLVVKHIAWLRGQMRGAQCGEREYAFSVAIEEFEDVIVQMIEARQ